jgi:uncharacterized YigZ family protein
LRDFYKTLHGEGYSEYEEKKSRFIGSASPAASEGEALAFIASVRAKQKDASHNVFAYLCGEKGLQKRYSDDGEPQGTAGVPVLDVIEKGRLSDTVIVVTRYFGGTLLGAAGLIRSYGKAASLAVGAARVISRNLAGVYSILTGYPFYDKIKNELEKGGFAITGTAYDLDIEITVIVPSGAAGPLRARINEISAGAAIFERTGDSYIDTFC